MRTINVLFLGNGPNSNRGCEAILRGSLEILKKIFTSVDSISIYNLASDEADIDIRMEDNKIRLKQIKIILAPKNKQERILRAFSIRFLPFIWTKLFLSHLIPYIKAADIVLSIGGDNYTTDYGVPLFFIHQGRLVKKLGKPFVIFGASIGPFDDAGIYKNKIVKHLCNEVDLILVREDRSLSYLKGIGCKNVKKMADPAFLMNATIPKDFNISISRLKTCIGLNITPLIVKRNLNFMSRPDLRIKELALSIHRTFNSSVLLIYHVTSAHSDDYKLLRKSYHLLSVNDKKKIFLLKDGLNAPEIKWVISNLSCFIGARTHATIAAFSSFIPTVSLAYSMKAWGINEDLFGHDKYVIDATTCTAEDIIESIKKVKCDSKVIRKQLSDKIHYMKELADKSGSDIKKLIEY